ncbi:unnamed protein product [Lymnaea stagnalis]|uniref:Large ribosomal subunit protein uL16m n=1 Tax=Lymnaea stagnalis TaxID=6523 RepID=A0AAV2H3A7_LYMST
MKMNSLMNRTAGEILRKVSFASITKESHCCFSLSSCLSLKLKQPPNYDHVNFPERRRLKIIDKIPPLDPSTRPPKMMKDLHQMRGPELVQNKLLYGDFGLQAVTGGRITQKDTEAIRMIITKQMDDRYMFATWRFNHLWQAVSRKGQGRRMGGGKGSIDHYCLPVKAERIILEMGGRCDFKEVVGVLYAVRKCLSFRTRVVTHESMRKREELEQYTEKHNINPFTFKYCVQNNVLGCSKFLNRYDYMWYGKYL